MEMHYDGLPWGKGGRGEHMLSTYGSFSVSPQVLEATGQDVVLPGF